MGAFIPSELGIIVYKYLMSRDTKYKWSGITVVKTGEMMGNNQGKEIFNRVFSRVLTVLREWLTNLLLLNFTKIW